MHKATYVWTQMLTITMNYFVMYDINTVIYKSDKNKTTSWKQFFVSLHIKNSLV